MLGLRQRDILRFWLPLFLSWLLMALEGPSVTAVLNRLPDATIQLAAFGLVLAISIFIEAPVISLLPVATAQVRDQRSYRLVRLYTISWCVGLTLIHLAVALTPLFDLLVRRLLAIPPEIADSVQPGLVILSLWSAAIGWRRFLQGVAIRRGRSTIVALGTALRLAVTISTALTTYALFDFRGVVIASIALMVGVSSEALFVTLALRREVRRLLATELQTEMVAKSELTAQEPELGRAREQASRSVAGLADLWRFHMPLASSSILVLLSQPMISTALARLDEPELQLAAWPMLFQLLFLFRAAALSLPEVVISLYGPGRSAPIRLFVGRLAVVTMALFALFAFSPLGMLYFLEVQGAERLVAEAAASGLLWFLPLPLITTLSLYLRGERIYTGHTRLISLGVWLHIGVLALALAIGVTLRLPGIALAAAAVNLAALAEFLLLLRFRAR